MFMVKHIRFILALIFLLISNALIYTHVFHTHDRAKYTYKEFPRQISKWKSKEVSYNQEVFSVLAPDEIIYRIYKVVSEQPITLFICYYNNFEKADFSHSPIVCFTGQGWKIENTVEKVIPINLINTAEIRVNQMIQTKLNTTMIALFWYQSTYHTFTNRGIHKLSLLFDKLLGKSDCNAFVRINITVPPEMSVEEVSSQLDSFVKAVYPEIVRLFA